jgi:circadian clock protein KaiB
VSGEGRGPAYALRLFITGMTPRSIRAIENVRTVCESHLKDRYELQVIDMYQQPVRAREEQILASPTLIKDLPLPRRRMIGDLSSQDRLLAGLDLAPIG